jgi:hypothetical protein
MSGSRTGHVRQTSLEPGLETAQVRFWDKVERPDMSELGADMSRYYCCNPIFGPDKSGWDLVTKELELGWTCPAGGANMSGNSF